MANIYLSYRITDRSLATEISKGLENRNHRVILDVDSIVPGQDWRAALQQGLAKSDCVVVLLSQEALTSSHFVLSEIGAARALGKVLIPILVGVVNIPSVVADVFCASYREDNLDEVLAQVDRAITKLANRNVFIVHGHDEAKKWEIKNFLKSLNLNAIILHEQDSMGKTIIEKFEHYASQSNFAFILMTPDDRGAASGDTESKWRARQNVIMELGWFMAKLGRDRVVILYKGELEIPTDILGVIYLKFNDSVLEVGEQIRQNLIGAGIIPS